MMMKTHLAIGSAFALMLLPFVTYKWVFFPAVLIASLLPDMDVAQSYIGKRWIFRPVQLFLKHRGLIHSFTFCLIISFLFAFFIPVLALPFFLGYNLHLIGDSLTVEGIRPFWPYKKEVSGILKTDGHTEKLIFYVAILANVVFFAMLFV